MLPLASSKPRDRSREELDLGGVGFLLGVAHRSLRRNWEECLADLGLTAPQAAVLRLVAATPGQGVRHLARRLGTDPMNVQRIVEALVAGGLCEARRDPADARRRPLHPTVLGKRLATRVAERARRSEKQLAAGLGEDVYRALVTGLHAVVELDAGGCDG